jgi:hypothetical protein
MENTEKILINALLDKYERSTAYRTGEQSNRRILLKLYNGKGKTDFSFYDISNHDRRVDVNTVIERFADKGLVSFKWHEAGHIIEKVWLNCDQMDNAYKLAVRFPKAKSVESISGQVQLFQNEVKSDWAKRYFNDVLLKAESKRDFGSSIPADNSERLDLWNLISFIDRHGELEWTERVLSTHLFSDSKRFEMALRSKLLSILRKYYDTDKVYDNDEELLHQIGIAKYPEYFEFCGALTFANEHGCTDFKPLSHGGSLCIADLCTGNIMVATSVKKIISIENRANYIEYIAKTKNNDELILYHAGQYSLSKKKFFTTINASMPKKCDWYHWGDIDLGGFSMLARLRREINPNIIPYRMSGEELICYDKYCGRISESYADKLRNLVGKPELIDCADCIQYMIKKKVRLEQESMLLM